MTLGLYEGFGAGAFSARGKPSGLGFEVSRGCRGPLASVRSDLGSQARSVKRSSDPGTSVGAGFAKSVASPW
jgi:hypothetical protein